MDGRERGGGVLADDGAWRVRRIRHRARRDAGDLKIEVAQRRPLTDLAAVHDKAAGRPA
ncbi:hypothetical protein [Actinomadura rubrisoli]|uniref:hypothetical protein n=1 Tax=Actinomadura rubrisoli TaxID=2530368 RepID=UPI00140496C7|nr:hypothetical protein [Actinomadura rubrisoli]